jgi:predicted phosphodiesterase
MKIAVLSDVHGNRPALLEAIADVQAWGPDRVVVAGDIVNRGPRSPECWALVQEMVRERGWLTVLGNHEEYVISHARPDAPLAGPQADIQRASLWTYRALGGDVSTLQAMPFSIELPGPDGAIVRLTHASMLGTRDGVYAQTPDRDLADKIGQPRPTVFCVGHTHQPLVRRLDGMLVVNAGAVGMPFDGDSRLCYARLTWQRGEWSAELVRLGYDRAEAERDFIDTGFLDDGGGLARVMLRELQISSGLIYTWAKRYEQNVLDGLLTVDQSVERFLWEAGE